MCSCCLEPLDLRIESKKRESEFACSQNYYTGYHDNSGIESPQFRNYEPSPVAQHYLCRSNVDPSNVYSNLSSSETDEGYDEGSPWPLVPDFNQLEQVPDPERDSQHNRSFSESPKERKKAVRELLPLAEKERRKPGRKPGQVSNVLHLWEFMRDLLHSANSSGIIEWISQIDGVFRVLNSTEVARLWGEKKKNKKKMTYEKLSRSLRYSRLEGYFADLPKDKNYPKKLCFKFGPKSKDWH